MKSEGPSDTAVAVPPALEGDDAKAATTLPMRKRKKAEEEVPMTAENAAKQAKTDESGELKPLKRPPMSKAREIRLEQNRKAARESRRRKKVMIEELQRSVIFFSRANGTLKQQNDELSRLLMQAQAQVNAVESGQQQQAQQPDGKGGEQPAAGSAPSTTKQEGEVQAAAPAAPFQFQNLAQQAQAQAVATQAMYESQGFPAAAARTAAQTMTASAAQPTAVQAAPSNGAAAPAPSAAMPGTPQTGATMQAMANFQQAAAAAVQAAMAMTPGAAAPSGNPQQAYTDTLNAFAMQQAAAAAAGQAPFAVLGLPQMQQAPFMPAVQLQGNQQAAWQQQQQAQPQQQDQQQPQQQQTAPAASQPAPAAPVQQNAESSA